MKPKRGSDISIHYIDLKIGDLILFKNEPEYVVLKKNEKTIIMFDIKRTKIFEYNLCYKNVLGALLYCGLSKRYMKIL